jgi:transcriptional regulator with XRE-family HTH domain
MRAKETGTGVVLAGLRAYRELRLLTQGELAGLAGVSRATIGDAEQGERISIRNARKIASALGIEAAQLLQPVQKQQQEGVLQHA